MKPEGVLRLSDILTEIEFTEILTENDLKKFRELLRMALPELTGTKTAFQYPLERQLKASIAQSFVNDLPEHISIESLNLTREHYQTLFMALVFIAEQYGLGEAEIMLKFLTILRNLPHRIIGNAGVSKEVAALNVWQANFFQLGWTLADRHRETEWPGVPSHDSAEKGATVPVIVVQDENDALKEYASSYSSLATELWDRFIRYLTALKLFEDGLQAPPRPKVESERVETPVRKTLMQQTAETVDSVHISLSSGITAKNVTEAQTAITTFLRKNRHSYFDIPSKDSSSYYMGQRLVHLKDVFACLQPLFDTVLNPDQNILTPADIFKARAVMTPIEAASEKKPELVWATQLRESIELFVPVLFKLELKNASGEHRKGDQVLPPFTRISSFNELLKLFHLLGEPDSVLDAILSKMAKISQKLATTQFDNILKHKKNTLPRLSIAWWRYTASNPKVRTEILAELLDDFYSTANKQISFEEIDLVISERPELFPANARKVETIYEAYVNLLAEIAKNDLRAQVNAHH